MDKLKQKAATLKKAQEKMIDEMRKQFPKDSAVSFFIMHGQKNPSTGVVVGHNCNGRLRVSHDQAKFGSRYRCRDVHYEDVL